MALMPKVIRPPLPSQYVASRSADQAPATSRGSRPTTMGASRRSTTKAVASEVSFEAQNRTFDPAGTSDDEERVKVYTDPRPPYGRMGLTLHRH